MPGILRGHIANANLLVFEAANAVVAVALANTMIAIAKEKEVFIIAPLMKTRINTAKIGSVRLGKDLDVPAFAVPGFRRLSASELVNLIMGNPRPWQDEWSRDPELVTIPMPVQPSTQTSL